MHVVSPTENKASNKKLLQNESLPLINSDSKAEEKKEDGVELLVENQPTPKPNQGSIVGEPDVTFERANLDNLRLSRDDITLSVNKSFVFNKDELLFKQ